MCGIWISVGFVPDPARLELVRHRGPDGDGWRVFDSALGPVALGHRRLAIIDASEAASQPMPDATGRLWLVFNGEIYNYLELRAELEAAGQRFRTRSDSEVLLAGFAQWGEAVLDRLLGMFAFGIWDAQAQRLFVARDRFGIKPLYYVARREGVAFASEIKQLAGLPGDVGRMNVARVHDFLAAGIADHTDETMHAGIRQLRGGESATLDLARWSLGSDLPRRRWYGLPDPGTIDMPEREAGDRFRALLQDSVRLHLRSDVPLGSCLSGGLDSSSIVCLMADLLDAEGDGGRVHSVSACYREKSVDERPFMEAVVEHARCEPAYVYPQPADAIALAERITWHQDEPFGSTSIFAQWSVFAEAKRLGIKVMLDGQGADEQLAGYHSSFGYDLAGLLHELRLVSAIRAIVERRRVHGLSPLRQMRQALAPLLPPSVTRALRRRQERAAVRGWLEVPFYGDREETSALDTALRRSGLDQARDVGELCIALMEAGNLAMLLHWEDRNSMAHGLEARVPFLDHRLVEFTIGLGGRHKLAGADTKRVLRRAMTGILPETIVKRRDKLGFATPEESWFRGPLRESIRDGTEEAVRRYPGLLNARGVRRLVSDMLGGRRPMDFTLWRIVNLGIWGRVFAVAL